MSGVSDVEKFSDEWGGREVIPVVQEDEEEALFEVVDVVVLGLVVEAEVLDGVVVDPFDGLWEVGVVVGYLGADDLDGDLGENVPLGLDLVELQLFQLARGPECPFEVQIVEVVLNLLLVLGDELICSEKGESLLLGVPVH